MTWHELKSAFTLDGSWRDLYVLGTSIADWQRLVDYLEDSDYLLKFRREDEQPGPTDVTSIFAEEIRPLLQVDLGGPVLNSHFFTEEEIEFDFDPRAIESDREGRAVLEFMRRIGDALGKPVRMTPENAPEIILILYDPATQAITKENEWSDMFGGT